MQNSQKILWFIIGILVTIVIVLVLNNNANIRRQNQITSKEISDSSSQATNNRIHENKSTLQKNIPHDWYDLSMEEDISFYAPSSFYYNSPGTSEGDELCGRPVSNYGDMNNESFGFVVYQDIPCLVNALGITDSSLLERKSGYVFAVPRPQNLTQEEKDLFYRIVATAHSK
ncbi:hypothetical protein H6776_02805 [Candidatus Nomurabacteria bacterium]|nr:hypothetical protein [Candidatus Nomurabacteria bacterium]